MGIHFARKKLLVAIASGAIIGLTGCGGGGGGGSSSSDDGDNTAPPETTEPEETIAAYFEAINFDPETAEYTGAGVNLAVYDGGILIGHSEFPASRVSQYSGAFATEFSTIAPETEDSWKLIDVGEFVNDNHDTDEYADEDERSHGSLVTAIAAGETVGIAPGTTIFAYDLIYSTTTDGSGAITDIDPAGGGPDSFTAYLHIAEKGKTATSGSPNLDLDFANLSLTAAIRYETGIRDTSDHMTKMAVETETAIIASAGNSGLDLSEHWENPGLFEPMVNDSTLSETIIIVGATDQAGEAMRSDSNTPGSNSLWQDRFIVAPGTAIEGADYTDADKTTTASGTSMAAPLVTGASALVKEKYPQLTNRQVLQVLLDTASKTIPNYDVEIHGQGLLDVEAALNVDPSLYTNP